MPWNRPRWDVSQITGLQYIQTCFQMGGAYGHQGLPGAGDLRWWSFSWRNCKSFKKCCLLLWLASGYLTVTELNHLLYHHLFSDVLMTSKMSTNPLNSFFFNFMKFSDGLHHLHGEEGDLLLLARMGDSLHLPSESWLQYCNHLSEKHHAAAFQQLQQLWESILTWFISIGLLNSSQWVTEPSNDLYN